MFSQPLVDHLADATRHDLVINHIENDLRVWLCADSQEPVQIARILQLVSTDLV